MHPVVRIHGTPSGAMARPLRPAWLVRRLELAAVEPGEWRTLVSITVGGALVAAIAALFDVPWFVLTAGAGGPMLAACQLWRWRDRGRERLVAELPVVLEAFARQLRAGLTPVVALEHVAAASGTSVDARIRSMTERLGLGEGPESAVSELVPDGVAVAEPIAVVLAMVLRGGIGGADAVDDQLLAR